MHRFIPSADASASPPLDPEHAAAIKRWTREILGLTGADDVTITVSELACADAGCPLVETVVAVFEPHRTRRWTFTRPRVAVTKLMVRQTLASPPAKG